VTPDGTRKVIVLSDAVLPRPATSTGSRWLWIVALLTVNIGLRMTWMVTHPGDLKSDPDLYAAHAKMVLDGHGFAGPSTGRPTAFRPIGYPLALAIVQWAGASPAAAIVLISMASAMAQLWLVRVYGRQSGWREHWIRAAQLAVAVDPLLVRYFALPMTEVPCAAILLGAVVALGTEQSVRAPGAAAPRRRLDRYFIAGVLFGWAALVRPVVMIAAGCVAGWFLVQRIVAACRSQESQWSRLVDPVTLCVGMTLVLLPWVVRNAVVFHEFIPATTHGGYTLALANNSQFFGDVIRGPDAFPWEGAALDRWQRQMIQEQLEDGIARADEPAEDAWYYRRARQDIAADPEAFQQACLLRLRRFWSLTTADPGTPSVLRAGVASWYALLWSGLLIGLWNGARSLWRRVSCRRADKSEQSASLWESRSLVLWWIVLSFAGMHTVYWTDTRMRAPVMPLLILLSVAGWSSLRPAQPGSDQV
jgi:hypothetical protein